MKIGLYDVDSHNFPNLALMKLSAYHKQQGDEVEIFHPLQQYDKVYVSKVFGDEYSQMEFECFNAKEVVFGGTGFAISIDENGKEVYRKDLDKDLPYEVEHIYPDYSLYPSLTKDTAYGFLTRGCCNNCDYCIVSQKEGLCSIKVADLNEFWSGQKYIKLLCPNLLACKDRNELLDQLIDSGAWVDFTQGLDARFVTDEISQKLSRVKKKMVHFAFDKMQFEKQIIRGLENYAKHNQVDSRKSIVYRLTNYDTTLEEDLYRLSAIKSLGYAPDVRIYRKPTAPQVIRDMQHWCNNRLLYNSTPFSDFIPRSDGKTIKELYGIGDKNGIV